MKYVRDGLPDVAVTDILDIARAAGQAIMKIYAEDPETWDSRFKADDTPVTKADLRADELICTRLREAYPDIPIISEESEHLPYEERSTYSYCWVVDPLDGTKEFKNRTGEFAVMIGLCLNGSPILGVVHAPARDEPMSYYAVAGQGAFALREDACGEGLGGGTRLSVLPFASDATGLRLAVSKSRPPEEFIASCDKPTLMTLGSAALKALAVAEGKVHMFPCIYNTSEWDTCATQVIVEEAGGAVVGCRKLTALKDVISASCADDLSAKLVYNKVDLGNPHHVFMGLLRD